MISDLVSVIIPVYNGDRYLGQAIESVIAQTYRPIEIIIVDDGSTDDTSKIAHQYPARYYFQSHKGPAAARNLGVEQSQSEFIAFLDADDLWMPEKLALQMATLTNRLELEAVFGLVEQFDSPDIESTIQPYRFAGMTMNGMHAGAMLIRRPAFMRVGLFPTQWQVIDFFDWYTLAQEAELKTVTLQDVVMRRRVHLNNLTIRSREIARIEYTQSLKAALDRRRMRP